jgi:adenine deaminase
MLLALHAAGVPLMSGTDAVVPVMVPGFSLHDELETMVDIGMSPYEVLKTSTSNPALYLDQQEEFGTIEKGKRADLVLLKKNPLEDIANTREIAGTMVRGRWYSRADLDIILDKVADHYQEVETTNPAFQIIFWIGASLLGAAVLWYVVYRVRRRRSA